MELAMNSKFMEMNEHEMMEVDGGTGYVEAGVMGGIGGALVAATSKGAKIGPVLGPKGALGGALLGVTLLSIRNLLF